MFLMQITVTRKDTIILRFICSDDVFKNSQNMYFEMYELNLFHFFPAELAWQAALKKAKKINLLTDIGILLMVEKDISGGVSPDVTDRPGEISDSLTQMINFPTGSLTVILTVLLFGMYFFLLALVFVLQ